MGVDPARLYTQLQNTGLANKDNPLYQLIYQLIGQLLTLTNSITALTNTTSGGGTTTINNIIQQLNLDGGSDNGGGDSDTIPGPAGQDGANGMVPYYIGPGEIFTVPLYKQALFSMNIDNEGILELDGFLIEVD